MKNELRDYERFLPVYDYHDGMICFISIANREYCRPMLPEIADMLKEPTMPEYKLQALHNYLTGHENGIVYTPFEKSMIERRFNLTKAMAAHIGVLEPPKLMLFHSPDKQEDFIALSRKDFMQKHHDVSVMRYAKAKGDYVHWKRMVDMWNKRQFA